MTSQRDSVTLMDKDFTDMLEPISSTLTESALSRDDGRAITLPTAVQLYDQACGDVWRARIWSALCGHPNQLDDLELAKAQAETFNYRDAGLQTVSIRQIRGSEGRRYDFDAGFHPLQSRTRDRWLSIARARLRGATLPPIELIKVGEVYFVRDGHHRLSVARALGEEFIEAQVTVAATIHQASRRKPWSKQYAFSSRTINDAHARA